MANKSWSYYASYYEPDEVIAKTPARRKYSVAGPFRATTASRAITHFWKEMETYGWGKKDVVLLGVLPAELTKDQRKED